MYFRPGATILSLQNYIQSQFSVEHTPDFVILHVGTNSLARCGLLTTFVRQYRSLIYTVRFLYPTAKIFISELLAREQFDVIVYNTALVQITKDCGCYLIRSGITKEDLDYDGLHLFEQGYAQLATDIKRSIDAGRKPRPIYPASMIPPTVRQKKKEKERWFYRFQPTILFQLFCNVAHQIPPIASCHQNTGKELYMMCLVGTGLSSWVGQWRPVQQVQFRPSQFCHLQHVPTWASPRGGGVLP